MSNEGNVANETFPERKRNVVLYINTIITVFIDL